MCLVLAAACVPLVAGFLVAYPRPRRGRGGSPRGGPGGVGGRDGGPGVRGGPLGGRAAATGASLLGAAMLAVYVGLEISMGNWGFSFLVQARGAAGALAGYMVSGYWLGLTWAGS